MGYAPFLIAPFGTGLDSDAAPWLLPQDAFTSIVNGHIHHGVVEKRNGYSKLGDITYSDGMTETMPGNSVMGIERFVDSSNVKEVIAFDTGRACKYNVSNKDFDPIDTSDIMNGGASDFIWAANWASTAASVSTTLYRLYFTNGKTLSAGLNGIRYYDGGSTTFLFNPNINTASTPLNGCKLMFALKQRLVVLHTFEGARTYPQRARWCQAQKPGNSGAFTDEWNDNVAGKGGFVDCPTGDQIISAQNLQNRLIVYFTNSVWSLSPTSDPALPFRWDQINDFRACGGKMTTAGFDRYVLASGVRGITATDGVETQRMDERIEEFVTSKIKDKQFAKVFARRDFSQRRLWMLYPESETSSDDSTAALIYSEESSSFSTYEIALNVLGYGGASQDDGLQDFGTRGLQDFGNLGLQDFYFDEGAEVFLGGDRTGQILTLGLPGDEGSIDFSLKSAAWNPWMTEGKQAQMGYVDLFIDTHQETELEVDFFVNNEPYPYKTTRVNMLPELKEIGTVSNITQANPGVVSVNQHGLSNGDEVFIYGVTGMTSVNDVGLTVTVVDGDQFSIGVNTSAYTAYANGGLATKKRFSNEKVWKRVFAGGSGYQHRLGIKSSGTNTSVSIHAFMPWFRQRGSRPI